MRAWQSPHTPGIDALRVVDTPVPVPGPHEILIRTEAASLNFSDLLMIDGTYQIRPDRPFTPGQEVAGTVVKTDGNHSFPPGTRVTGKVLWGGFAEYVPMRAEMAIRIPHGMTAPAAAALPVAYTTAMVALVEDAGIGTSDTVLIHAAAGGVGLAAVQVAKSYGSRVIAAASGLEKCALAREEGADVAIDYQTENFAAVVNEATDGQGASIIFDSVGGEVTRQSLRCLAWQGQLLIVGFSSGEIAGIPANRLLLRRAVARGIYWSHERDAEMIDRCTQRLLDLCRSDKIRPVIRDQFRFADLPLALRKLQDGRSSGKIVLAIQDEERGQEA